MKKVGFQPLVVSAAVCILLSACNFTINGGKELAEVRVGGGVGRAANPATGLPIFDGANTTVTITDASGRMIAEGPIPLSAEVVVGVEIVVRATVQTATSTWTKTKTHTVQAGINDIDLELSKAPNVVGNLFFDVAETISEREVRLRLRFRNGTTFDKPVLMGGNYRKPVVARDSIGRIYLLCNNNILTRFDVDGNEDTGFESAASNTLPSGTVISAIRTIAVDTENNNIFLFVNNTAYCLIENGHNNFTRLDSGLPGIGSSDTVHAAAAYDGMLFVKARVSGNAEKLFAYEYEIGSSALTVTSKGAASSSDFEINSKVLDCTGLFADESGVYCLLAAKNDRQNSEPLYAVGKLIRYSHDMSDKDEFGLNPSSGTPFQSPVSHGNSLTFDARYFSYPALFIGYDEDYLYIADDGVGIANGKEGWRVTGEKNRIAAFNRKTNILTFTDTAATWFAYYNEYPSKKTAVLQWEKKEPTNSLSPMRYWTSADGKSVFSETNKLWDPSAAEKPTDIFCYDQDGNLYILWSDTGYTYYVRRFIAGVDGYVKDGDATLGTLSDISAIAVDISDGKKTLYYSYKTSPTSRFVKSLVWDTDFYSAAFPTTVYEIQTGSTEITALAANRDGVFVGLKEEFVDSTIDKYRLKVKKYKKIGNPALSDGEITLFDNAVSYTNLENVPIPKPIGTAAGHEYQEAINGLQVFDGVLYGISSKLHQVWQEQAPSYYVVDIVKNGSILYKIGNTAGTFSDSVEQIAEKASNDASKTGYGFYRFIAVKYDEAERIRLIIASDGAWGTGGANPPPHNPNDLKNTDKVLEYDLAGHLQGEKNSGGNFSKTLKLGSGFEW